MGGRGDTSKSFNENKVVSNIDASRNKPFRDKRAKELETERTTKSSRTMAANSFKGFRPAGDSLVKGVPVLLSKKTLAKAIDLPDATQGHIGTPDRRASAVARAFNEGLLKQRMAGKKPTDSFAFKLEMQTSARTQATFAFKGRMVRDPSTKKLVAGAVNLVRIEK